MLYPASPCPNRWENFSYWPGTVSCTDRTSYQTSLRHEFALVSSGYSFPGATISSPQQNGHWTECALGAPYHFLGLFPMCSPCLFSIILVPSRARVSLFFAPCLTAQYMWLLLWLSPWLTFYPLVTTWEPAHVLHSVSNE